MTEAELPLNGGESQISRILDYMLAGNSITPLLALQMFGSFRLGGRIYDLKKAGWNVQTEIVQSNKKKFASYRIPVDRLRVA